MTPLRLHNFLGFLMVAICLPIQINSFTSPLSFSCHGLSKLKQNQRFDTTQNGPYSSWRAERSLSAEASPVPTSFGSEADKEDARKDNPFKVGAVVRIAAEGIKAYQVKPKGFGKFDENKNFVPALKGGPRDTKNLVVPVGMRGVVTKVYDVDDISANFPIQVKFTPGENTDEGYDPPIPFIMHLLPEELELV